MSSNVFVVFDVFEVFAVKIALLSMQWYDAPTPVTVDALNRNLKSENQTILTRRFIALNMLLIIAGGNFLQCLPPCSAGPEIQSPAAQKKLQLLTANIRANPNDPKPYIERADFFTDYMMLGSARADINRSIAIAPTGSAYAWLAKISASNSRDPKEALAYLAQGRKCSDHDLQGLIKTANVYTDLHLYESAIECYDAALKLHPSDWNLIEWRARNFMWAGHFEKAISGENYVLSKLPPLQNPLALKGAKEGSMPVTLFELRSDAHKVRGISLSKLHRYTEALTDLNLALQLVPNSPQLLEARAEVYRKLGKTKLAEQDLKAITGNRDFLFDNALFANPK